MTSKATTTNPARTSKRKQAQRIPTMSHVLVGLTAAWQAIGMLSAGPKVLAWASLVTGIGLVFAGIYELFEPKRHHLAIFIVGVVAGIEICVVAMELFHQHKHYVQWVMLAGGLATIAGASIRFVVGHRGEQH
jgi:membrane protein DedA with SNARE-associated domain